MRLIDADELNRAITNSRISLHTMRLKMRVSDILLILKSAPTIDAVPVVRCRDCQYGDQNTCGDGYWCWKYGIGVSEEHFCAKGVKAKEERNESE